MLIFLFAFSQLYPVVSRNDRVHYSAGSHSFFFFFFFFWLSQGLVIWPRLGDPFVHQNTREVCAFHFPGRILSCVQTSVRSNFNFLHNSYWITQSGLVLYSFCASLLHWLMRVIVLSLLPQPISAILISFLEFFFITLNLTGCFSLKSESDTLLRFPELC